MNLLERVHAIIHASTHSTATISASGHFTRIDITVYYLNEHLYEVRNVDIHVVFEIQRCVPKNIKMRTCNLNIHSRTILSVYER